MRLLSVLLVLSAAADVRGDDDGARPIDFDRDIRPILAEACLTCHGPDAERREANLRLDDPRSVLQPRDKEPVIVAGQPGRSVLMQRIRSETDALRMPPPDAARQLSRQEMALLERWIAQGADYAQHWSFTPVQRPPIPRCQPAAGSLSTWPRNPIDHFILERLLQAGLKPLPPADRQTLLRRVTLDLTGLPPTAADRAAFRNDRSPDAYERLVDRLLASPHYGERMAIPWLDLARYADSGGYQGDIPRTMWPWRDWVIAAYNGNVPFDRFTLEQLAGDLLPNPTSAQIIATGFNRNHRINDEDGILPEEFRVEYVVDRVETTSTTWMGLTLGCARCHDHKYDPFTRRDFYGMFAFFNSVAEYGRGYGNSQPLYYFDESIRAEIEAIDARLIDLGDAAQGEYQQLIDLKKQRDKVLSESLTTMVMQELPEPRTTYRLEQGRYDRPAERVDPAVLDKLLPAPEHLPSNRLGLARWLVAPRHPLTARVAVNRFWQLHFGRGFVETPEDFGTRSARPEHAALLDWLAAEFVRSGWNVKAMHRLIVTSAAYRQTSVVGERRYRHDPENRLISRGPRVRLDAEILRDQALAAAGLLDQRIGGTPVKPYQPAGVWDEMVSAFPQYEQSHGADLYRRSLYTFIRRTVQPPAMNAWDFPSRETCQVRRTPTNTPLQALVLMNDPTYVEAARVLAARSLAPLDACGTSDTRSISDSDWLRDAFQRVLVREPTAEELALLERQLNFHRRHFAQNEESAQDYVHVGESPASSQSDTVELAARTAITTLILNLDEVLYRE